MPLAEVDFDPTEARKDSPAKSAAGVKLVPVDGDPSKPQTAKTKTSGPITRYTDEVRAEAGEADSAYRRDMAKAVSENPKHPLDLVGNVVRSLAPVGDALAYAASPVTAAFTEGPGRAVADIATAAGIKRSTPIIGALTDKRAAGDIASFAIPLAGEAREAAAIERLATNSGVDANTLKTAIKTSKATESVRAAKTAASPPRANQLADMVKSFDRAGVRPTIAALGPGYAKVAKTMAENPIAGVRARQNLAASVDDTRVAVNRMAHAFGDPASRGAAGEAVQEAISGHNERFSADAGKRYDEAFEPILAEEKTRSEKAAQEYAHDKALHSDEIENRRGAAEQDYRNRLAQATQKTAQARIDAQREADLESGRKGQRVEPREVAEPYVYPAEVPNLQEPAPRRGVVIDSGNLASAVRSMTARGQSPALKNLFTPPEAKKLAAAVNDPSSISFQDLRDARTWVRTAQGNPELRQSIGTANLERLEGALTKDIYANAEALTGKDGVKKLQDADQFYREGSQRLQGALQAFVGKGGSAPKAGESTYDLVVRAAGEKGGADIARLQTLKSSLKPKEWGDLASTVIHRMGEGETGKFSINSFVTKFDNLSAEGKDVLFGRGAKREELDNLASVARRQKDVERAANHSNTASSAQAAVTTSGITAGAFHPAAILPVGATLGGMALTGEGLTNPGIARMLANRPSANTLAQQALGRVQQSRALRQAPQQNALAQSLRPAMPAQSMPAPLNPADTTRPQ